MRRVMEITTPLGKEELRFYRMTAHEALGRLSEFQIDLLSSRGDINLDEILAKNVTVKLELPKAKARYFNGYVTRFAQAGMHGSDHLYHATMRPWLWFLTRTSDCRIFQKLTVPDIIQQVFDDHSQIVDVKKELTGTYREWEYCVQYRETDFSFVSRLMEQEGIYYYFKHADGRHTLVLADSYAAHSPFQGFVEIPFVARERAAGIEHECITEWNFTREIQPGRYMIDDYNAEKPRVELQVTTKIKRKHDLADYEIYDYPGEYITKSEGDEVVRTRIEELHAQFELASGNTAAHGVCSGYLFKLTDHVRADQNREYLIVSTVQNLECNEYESIDNTGANYRCGFTVLNSGQPFRSQRNTPKPIVQGPQTAVIVGPAGDEIYTDKYGRMKVQFHWDRQGQNDENSSCWVPVSQNWAGNRWGAIFLPRIGQEVIVDFLEGDPDRPIITGRVYNAEQMPPYDLPAEMTKSTIKSHSSKGGDGFNELRFDDKKGSEQVFLHAEHNQDNRVKNDSLEWVGKDRHLIVTSNQIEKVEGDKHLSVMGDQSEKIDGTASKDIVMDSQQKVGMKYALDAGTEIHLKAGCNLVIEAGTSLTLKVGGNFINLNPSGVSIQGTMLRLNSGGAAGSGAGCSPAAPNEPIEADDAKAGKKTTPPPAQKRQPTAASPSASSQATKLKDAANSGTPFCEI